MRADAPATSTARHGSAAYQVNTGAPASLPQVMDHGASDDSRCWSQVPSLTSLATASLVLRAPHSTPSTTTTHHAVTASAAGAPPDVRCTSPNSAASTTGVATSRCGVISSHR